MTSSPEDSPHLFSLCIPVSGIFCGPHHSRRRSDSSWFCSPKSKRLWATLFLLMCTEKARELEESEGGGRVQIVFQPAITPLYRTRDGSRIFQLSFPASRAAARRRRVYPLLRRLFFLLFFDSSIPLSYANGCVHLKPRRHRPHRFTGRSFFCIYRT